jgi:hypothetical protein
MISLQGQLIIIILHYKNDESKGVPDGRRMEAGAVRIPYIIGGAGNPNIRYCLEDSVLEKRSIINYHKLIRWEGVG